jgi:hypothetical protein
MDPNRSAIARFRSLRSGGSLSPQSNDITSRLRDRVADAFYERVNERLPDLVDQVVDQLFDQLVKQAAETPAPTVNNEEAATLRNFEDKS